MRTMPSGGEDESDAADDAAAAADEPAAAAPFASSLYDFLLAPAIAFALASVISAATFSAVRAACTIPATSASHSHFIATSSSVGGMGPEVSLFARRWNQLRISPTVLAIGDWSGTGPALAQPRDAGKEALAAAHTRTIQRSKLSRLSESKMLRAWYDNLVTTARGTR